MKTREEASAIQMQWIKDLERICKHHGDLSVDRCAVLRLWINFATFILETGMTAETIETFVEEQIDAFEKHMAERSGKPSCERGEHGRSALRR